MPSLHLQFDIDISDAEQDLLCDVLNCAPVNLAAAVQSYGPAAVREYLDMFTGTAPITTATDVRERRLVALMLTTFQAAAPEAGQIARLFNITPSAAKALLRSVAAKHRLRVRAQLEASIRHVLDSATQPAPPNGPYGVVIASPLVVELLNVQLATSPDARSPVRLSGDSINRYTIDVGSFDYLRALYP